MAAIREKNYTAPVTFKSDSFHWLIIGGGTLALKHIRTLLANGPNTNIKVIAEDFHPALLHLSNKHHSVHLHKRSFASEDCKKGDTVVIATGDAVLDEEIYSIVKTHDVLVCIASDNLLSDFIFEDKTNAYRSPYWLNDKAWKRITTKIIIAFSLMIFGYFAITYLPMPSAKETWAVIQPHITYQFFFFILAGFLAQMVDGVLGMGYGVTSATCLMAFGVNPVAMSASIHTSEIFTTGVSGYSHYRFGNVNKKLFKHLVIPGVAGAVAGALLLVYLGDRYGKILMPIIALYAGFLGCRILIKAFKEPTKGKKVKRIGWLAGAGGFLDSFGGGGWGPIVTSSLMAKGRSPKYTIGSVNLTEFFVTVSSAFAFFLTIGISHWTIVLGLLTGGSIAAPLAAKLTGKLPRKTMMICVGVMVIIWCVRMIFKSL
jgi:uncharacterized membrane protein YfcA